MKKAYYLSVLLALLPFIMRAQFQYTILSDLTSELQNSDFTADSPITVTIYTYDYDMKSVTVGTSDVSKGLFGQQAVTGWSAANLSDNVRIMENSSSTARTDGTNARAAGVFAYIDDAGPVTSFPGLGGAYYAPYLEEGVTSQGLGIVAVWGASLVYSQDVTLPAGGYMMIVQVQNTAGSAAAIENNNGFIDGNGKKYMSKNHRFKTGVWSNDTIVFLLEEGTTGQVTLGYKSGNYGSGSAMHLFIDNVKLYSVDPLSIMIAEIAEAKEQLLALINEGTVFGVDVSNALAVYNDPSATLEQVKQAIEEQNAINYGSGITVVDYISNPIECVINTDIYPTQNTRFEIKMDIVSDFWMGCWDTTNHPDRIFSRFFYYQNSLCYDFPDDWGGSSRTMCTVDTANDGTPHIIQFGNKYVKDLTTGRTASKVAVGNFTIKAPFGLFGGMEYNGEGQSLQHSPHGGNEYKIYYFKAYENDVLIADMIPVKDGNGTLCMYDLVRERYFYRLDWNGNRIQFENPENPDIIDQEIIDETLMEAYEAALASLIDGHYYQIYTYVEDIPYYLTSEGTLTVNENEAYSFQLTSEEVNGTKYQFHYGWNMSIPFTNPDLTNGAYGDIVNDGSIHTNYKVNRNDFERQVLFLQDGKYSIRATNSSSPRWGADSYWDMTGTFESPEAGYNNTPSYIWLLSDLSVSHEYDLTVSDAGMSTLYLDFPVVIPDDDNLMAVMYVNNIEGNILWLKKVKNYIPANTGVIIMANPVTITFYGTNKAVSAITDNQLQGVTKRTSVSSIDGTVYTLGRGVNSGYMGFHRYTGTYLPANKAFLVRNTSSEVNNFNLVLDNEDGTSTAIGRIEDGEFRPESNVIYDLQGRRVENPTKGFYIVNGRKQYIK